MPVDPVRDAAIEALLRIETRGAHVEEAIDRKIRRAKLSDRGRRFFTQLVYGTLRNDRLCQHAIETRLTQPFSGLPAPIQTILRMGAFQALFCGQVTFPAMVHTSVELAKKHGHAGTARLTNAVLKRIPQTLDAIPLSDKDSKGAEWLALRYSLPQWLVSSWLTQFGAEKAEQICLASASEPPLSLRANVRLLNREALAKRLASANCLTEPVEPFPEALRYLDGPPPQRLSLFRSGHFSIQDCGSMAAVHLLAPDPAACVLDICAAPGGKSTHLAECIGPEGRVIAMDLQPRRLRSLQQQATRLGHPGIHAVAGDGSAAPFEGPFDYVLLDAPCTGLGTLRRHPDLKRRAGPEDAARLAETQRALLRSAIALCKDDGVIVYSVCTFTQEETEDVIKPILAERQVLLEDGPEWLMPWKTHRGQYRILPRADGPDGFFLTRLRKRSSP